MNAGKIERIELYHIDAPLPSPLFPVWIPGYPQYRQCHTLLSVTTRDGLTGWATGVAFDREREGLGDFIGRFLLGLDPYDVEAASERLRQAGFLGWRNAWMETAFWDLAAKRAQVPLHVLLAEKINSDTISAEIPTAVEPYASFWEMRSAKVRAETVERAKRLGFRGAKLNVCSGSVAEDVEKMRIAREAVGDDFHLMAHARQAWSVSLVETLPRWDLARASQFIDEVEEYKVDWLQEPLENEAWDELADLSRKSKIPIAGGDITITIVPLKALIERKSYSVLTPDAAFAGLSNVVRTMKLCLKHGLDFSPSSNSDGIGLAANLHALVAWSRVAKDQSKLRLEFPWEPPAMIPEHRDVILKEPLHIRSDGMLPVPSGHGLGVEIDTKALRRYGRKFYTLTPVRFVVSSARRTGLQKTAELTTQKPGRRRRTASRVTSRT
jgi:L-alanine-DL-glutamate epimerase-like enolase superfamily enzyme